MDPNIQFIRDGLGCIGGHWRRREGGCSGGGSRRRREMLINPIGEHRKVSLLCVTPIHSGDRASMPLVDLVILEEEPSQLLKD